MIRGDTKYFNFKIKLPTGEYIDGSIYDEVEVQFNQQNTFTSLKYLKSKGQVTWDIDHFVVYLSQADTFKLNDGTVEMQVRLKQSDIVKGTAIINVPVGRVLSNEVLD